MKILLCHNFYRQRGGERVAVEAQEALLKERGHQVIRLFRDNTEIDGFSLGRQVTLSLGTVHARSTAKEVARIVAREAPDLAHVHNVFPLLSPSLYRALANRRVPIVQSMHNFRFLCPNGFFFTHGETCERCRGGNTLHAVRLRCYRDSRLASAVYAASIGAARWSGTFKHIDRFLALTPFHVAKLVEGGVAPPSRVTVLPYFLPEPLEPAPFRERGSHVLFLGRLSREKGADLAVDALGRLPSVRLAVVGDGPERESLVQRAESVAKGRVEFLGYQSGREKEELIRKAAVMVVPSRWYEGLPFVALEAFSAGLPVVAADHGGLRDVLVEHEAGLTHSPGDATDLARVLERVLGDHPLRRQLGRNARRLFEARYTAETHYRQLVDVYREVTSCR